MMAFHARSSGARVRLQDKQAVFEALAALNQAPITEHDLLRADSCLFGAGVEVHDARTVA